MKQIKDHIRYILENGIVKPGREGRKDTDDASLSTFSRQLRFDLAAGLPFVTSKKLHVIPMLKEITWMIRGETNVNTLGCSIWDKWAAKKDLGVLTPLPEIEVIKQILAVKPELKTDYEASQFLFELTKKYFVQPDNDQVYDVASYKDVTQCPQDFMEHVNWGALDAELKSLGVQGEKLIIYVKAGDCGPIYGSQWRNYQTVALVEGRKGLHSTDQLMGVYDTLMNNRHSRRNIVDAWVPGLAPKSGNIDSNLINGYMGLPPCHLMFQFYIGETKDGREKLDLNLRMRSSDTGLGLPFNIGSYALINHIYAAEFNFVPGELVLDLIDAHIYLDHQEGLKTYLDRPEHPLPTLNFSDYEERKRKVIDKFIEDNVRTFEGEEREERIAKHRERIYAETESAARTRFEILLNNITHEFFEGAIENYVCEDEIKLPLHD